MEKRQSLSTRGRKTVGTTGEGAGKELWSLGVDLRILGLVEQRAGFPVCFKETRPIQNQNKGSSTKHFNIQHAHTQYSLPPSGFIHQTVCSQSEFHYLLHKCFNAVHCITTRRDCAAQRVLKEVVGESAQRRCKTSWYYVTTSFISVRGCLKFNKKSSQSPFQMLPRLLSILDWRVSWYARRPA